MNEANSQDRRKYIRAKLHVEVLCFKTPADRQRGAGVLSFYSRDLSAGGVFLETALPLDVGTQIYLKFNLPHTKKIITTQARVINTKGKVVRVKEKNAEEGDTPGMGVEFEHLGFEDQQLIDSFVHEIAQDEEPA